MTLKARPTTYRGVEMRSRLEARFAQWLDADDLGWVYEPRAYGGRGGQYLPDFQIDGPSLSLWFVEVRPTVERAFLALARMQVIWESEPYADLMVATPEGLWFHGNPVTRRWKVIARDGWF
jgi:hypothetical protein